MSKKQPSNLTVPNGVVSHFKKHNMEWQFADYETGNVIAAIAGTGGFYAFADNVSTVFSDQSLNILEKTITMATEYPDASVAIGIALSAVGADAAKRMLPDNLSSSVDNIAIATGAGILTYTAAQTIGGDASLITASAASFVTGSALLRKVGQNPFMLKLGGTCLAAGGALLAAFGGASFAEQFSNGEFHTVTQNAFDAMTFVTGLYVSGASAGVYEGGIYAVEEYDDNAAKPLTGVERLTHPKRGALSKLFAKYVDGAAKTISSVAKKATPWVSQQMKEQKHFATSMWMRIPWRFAGAVASLANGDTSMAASFLLWAKGDVMIGLEDYKESKAPSEPNPTGP